MFRTRIGIGMAVLFVGGCTWDPSGRPRQAGAAVADGDSTGADVQPVGGPPVAPQLTGDMGLADPSGSFRGLLGLPYRSAAELEQTLVDLYDPDSPRFHQFLSRKQFLEQFAPTEDNIAAVTTWASSVGLAVARVASNRRLVEITGTVAQFNAAFATELHKVVRNNTNLYGTLSAMVVPTLLVGRVTVVFTPDLAADTRLAPPDMGSVSTSAPPGVAFDPGQLATAYGVTALGHADARGGISIGIVGAGGVARSDTQSFWQSLGIRRDDARVVQTMEAPSRANIEATLDVEWAGGMVPGAEVVLYAGPDIRDTSLLYTFNEAVGHGEVQVITDSFSRHATTEPGEVTTEYDESAKMAAALGITVVAASGDSAQVDVPSSSPLVTAVGGTELMLASDGRPLLETAWRQSGCGVAMAFTIPNWQSQVVTDSMGSRAVSDVAVNATNDRYYFGGNWSVGSGTSFASPIFAGLIAAVDAARARNGLPPIGFLNSLLYQHALLQSAFRDITMGASGGHNASTGWDYPTGWGAPNAVKLAQVMP
jgi:kumamolisin